MFYVSFPIFLSHVQILSFHPQLKHQQRVRRGASMDCLFNAWLVQLRILGAANWESRGPRVFWVNGHLRHSTWNDAILINVRIVFPNIFFEGDIMCQFQGGYYFVDICVGWKNQVWIAKTSSMSMNSRFVQIYDIIQLSRIVDMFCRTCISWWWSSNQCYCRFTAGTHACKKHRLWHELTWKLDVHRDWVEIFDNLRDQERNHLLQHAGYWGMSWTVKTEMCFFFWFLDVQNPSEERFWVVVNISNMRVV